MRVTIAEAQEIFDLHCDASAAWTQLYEAASIGVQWPHRPREHGNLQGYRLYQINQPLEVVRKAMIEQAATIHQLEVPCLITHHILLVPWRVSDPIPHAVVCRDHDEHITNVVLGAGIDEEDSDERPGGETAA